MQLVTPVFHYHRFGLTFDVFPERIEVTQGGGFGTKGELNILPIANIVSVDVEGFLSQTLTVQMSDGNAPEYQLGRDGPKARAAIAKLLEGRRAPIVNIVEAPPPPAPPSPMQPGQAVLRTAEQMRAQIAEFADLRDNGDIIEEEYAVHRAEVLAGRI